jgi:dephospho-CoA kinase
MKKAIYFLTGSSASGKTTLLKSVVKNVYPGLNAHHMDELGLPTPVEILKFGGPSQWQTYAVRRWIENVSRSEATQLVVLEGQARPTIVLEAAEEARFSAIHVVLIDCSHAERRRRLLGERANPELDKLDMYAWAAYLRGQADALKMEIIDTTGRRVEDCLRELAASIERFAEAEGVPLGG